MSIPKMIMLVGLPGSGKSYWATELAKQYNANIHSSDAIREELSGDVNNQDINNIVFTTLHKRIKEDLNNGKSCIYDATNLSCKRRMAFLRELKNIPCEKICEVMATPYKECLRHNAERERKVPESVIKRMYMNFEIPYWYEGWTDIGIQYSDGAKGNNGGIGDWVLSVMNYNQHNSHHTLTLGEHCMATFQYINKLPFSSRPLKAAALIHDCGKPKTATYINSKGEHTEECHYYQHHSVGAYDSLFFSGIYNHLYTAVLIQWHMQMHFNKEQKTKDKWRKLWGEDLYKDLCILHEADLAAH